MNNLKVLFALFVVITASLIISGMVLNYLYRPKAQAAPPGPAGFASVPANVVT